MGNLDIYNAVRAVPKEAKREIKGGRLKGKTDINPMWRIKTLTEQFGECGNGWFPEIVNRWTEAGANGEVSAFVEIKLYLKFGGEWGKPIAAMGGSAFVAKEQGGLYTSDECYKMAFTDALSVACKMIGVGADVYWDSDPTKYSRPATESQIDSIKNGCMLTSTEESEIVKYFNVSSLKELSESEAKKAIAMLNRKADKQWK